MRLDSIDSVTWDHADVTVGGVSLCLDRHVVMAAASAAREHGAATVAGVTLGREEWDVIAKAMTVPAMAGSSS